LRSLPIDPQDIFARGRPRPRWSDAATLLRHFALVTFDVDPDRLAAALPAGLTPEIRTLDDGRRRGFVSAVSFRDIDFRFRGAELVRASFNQTNYRAYVLGPDNERAVFFFETTLDSRLAVIPRRLWGMPWFGGRTTIAADWEGDRCVSYRHVCTGQRNAVEASFAGTADAPRRLDGFRDADDTFAVLTHPLDGYFRHPSGRLGRYSVWHPRLEPTLGAAVNARYTVFELLGLVQPGTVPHSVLLQPSIEFDVRLPPTS
jgi:hypothetical protein